MLTVPPRPSLRAAAPGVAALETPITIALGPVTPTACRRRRRPTDTSSRCVAYRHASPGALDGGVGRSELAWVPEASRISGGSRSARVPAGRAAARGRACSWRRAAGRRAAQPQFAKAAGGYPAYTFRGSVRDRGRRDRAQRAERRSVTFVGRADRNLDGARARRRREAGDATEARLQLKNPALRTIGGLVIQRASPGAEVTLSNAAGASIVLQPDGSIELRPAPGQGRWSSATSRPSGSSTARAAAAPRRRWCRRRHGPRIPRSRLEVPARRSPRAARSPRRAASRRSRSRSS